MKRYFLSFLTLSLLIAPIFANPTKDTELQNMQARKAAWFYLKTAAVLGTSAFVLNKLGLLCSNKASYKAVKAVGHGTEFASVLVGAGALYSGGLGLGLATKQWWSPYGNKYTNK